MITDSSKRERNVEWGVVKAVTEAITKEKGVCKLDFMSVDELDTNFVYVYI